MYMVSACAWCASALARAIGRRKAVHRACRHSGDAVCAKLVDVCGGEGPDRLGEKAVALISVAELAITGLETETESQRATRRVEGGRQERRGEESAVVATRVVGPGLATLPPKPEPNE